MGETTAISWCDHTFNPWVGCMKLSPACDGCYAWAQQDLRYHRVEWGGTGKGRGTRALTSESNWQQPFRWNRKAQESGTCPFVFGGSLMDPFDKHVPDSWRQRYFNVVIRNTPHLLWLLLTKRPQLIVELSERAGGLPPNVALGTTVEDQERADINVPALLEAKEKLDPAFAFLSCEPLLGRVCIDDLCDGYKFVDALRGNWWHDAPDGTGAVLRGHARIDWVITGGETDQGGHKARPSNPQWFRALRDQCAAAGVPFHHKQNGEWVSVSEIEGPGEVFKFPDHRCVRRVGKHRSGRLLDGVEHNARPEVRL